MRQGTKKILPVAGIYLILLAPMVAAQNQGVPKDVFQGKLFALNIILERQGAPGLSKEQYTAIRAAVVVVQGSIAEHEWDLRQAYQKVLADLDESAG